MDNSSALASNEVTRSGWRQAIRIRKPSRRHGRRISDRETGKPDPNSTLLARFGPAITVLAPIVFSAIELRAEVRYVPHLNDEAFHSEMVRYATDQLRAGHFPLNGWFPFLNLGSPLFLHYQSLGATLAGLMGLAIGANHAFSVTLYLLLVAWPISIYIAGRLFGLSRWESAFAALVAPFVASATGVGYEQGAYLWSGFGLWSQLWAMWTLPLAWGFSWRAINSGKNYLLAALFIALTAAFHFETGYLAVIPIVLWAVIRPSRILERVVRAIVIGVGAFCLAAWVIVPLLIYRGWSSIDEFLQNTPDVNSYRARRALSWLFTGQIFDSGRWPVITILAGLGFLTCLARWRNDLKSRALVIASLVCLVLFFGRATLGAIVDILPGSRDIFFRRFIIGLQLSGILLAGIGAVAVARTALFLARHTFHDSVVGWFRPGLRSVITGVAIAGIVVGVTAPMWTQIARNDEADTRLIAAQRSSTRSQSEVDQLVATIRRIGGGRVYAGMAFSGWGAHFLVGLVPVSEYLSNDQVDEVGFTNRTQSLMSDPEAYFDDADPADFDLFGVRFLILPAGK